MCKPSVIYKRSRNHFNVRRLSGIRDGPRVQGLNAQKSKKSIRLRMSGHLFPSHVSIRRLPVDDFVANETRYPPPTRRIVAVVLPLVQRIVATGGVY